MMSFRLFLNSRHILFTAATPVKSHLCNQAGPSFACRDISQRCSQDVPFSTGARSPELDLAPRNVPKGAALQASLLSVRSPALNHFTV